MERINLEVNELKKCIEKIMQQDTIERWFCPYFCYHNIFGIDHQALTKMESALESLIKAIDIKYDNLVLSKRKDAKGYHYKE